MRGGLYCKYINRLYTFDEKKAVINLRLVQEIK